MRRGEKARNAIAQAGRRASRAVVIASLIMLGAMILGTAALAFVMDRANLAIAHSYGPSVFLLRPHWLIWAMIAAAMAMPAALLTYDPIARRLKGPPPPRWSIEYEMVFDSTQRFLRLGLLGASGIFALAGLYIIPYHVRVTDTAICLLDPGAWRERSIPYREITAVSLARYYVPGSKYSRGGPSRDRGLFVLDHRGRTWTPTLSTLAVKPERSAEIAAFVAARAGLPVEYPRDVRR